MNRPRLDCQDLETALSSVATVLDVAEYTLRETVQTFVRDVDPENYPGDRYRKLPRDIATAAGANLDRRLVGDTTWFHLTRTLNEDDFLKRGILPRNVIREELWEELGQLAEGVTPADWASIRNAIRTGELGRSAWMYNAKESHQGGHGPYAVLVRDIAFACDYLSTHDYLHVPELVEEIGALSQAHLGVDVIEPFLAAAKPCIVKFREDGLLADRVASALWYVYGTQRTGQIPFTANDCFVSDQGRIPAADVISVEILVDGAWMVLNAPTV